MKDEFSLYIYLPTIICCLLLLKGQAPVSVTSDIDLFPKLVSNIVQPPHQHENVKLQQKHIISNFVTKRFFYPKKTTSITSKGIYPWKKTRRLTQGVFGFPASNIFATLTFASALVFTFVAALASYQPRKVGCTNQVVGCMVEESRG